MPDNIIWMIVGMSVVTMAARVLPVLIVSRITIPPFWRRFLDATPYAALGALIFPGILGDDHRTMVIGLLAGGAALIVSFLRAPAFIAAFAATLAAAAGMVLLP